MFFMFLFKKKEKTIFATVLKLKGFYRLSFILALILVLGFKNPTTQDSKKQENQHINDTILCDSVVNYAKQFMNKRYCYGSKYPNCFDCSGLVLYVFKNFNINLPHCSECQGKMGRFVSKQNAFAGDLIFFTGRNKNSESIGHVGIVTEYKDNKVYFIHASVQAGVIISNTDEAYYKDRYLFIKRIKIAQ